MPILRSTALSTMGDAWNITCITHETAHIGEFDGFDSEIGHKPADHRLLPPPPPPPALSIAIVGAVLGALAKAARDRSGRQAA